MKRYTVEIRMGREGTIDEIGSSTGVNQSRNRIGDTRECYRDNERGVRMRFDRSEEVSYW